MKNNDKILPKKKTNWTLFFGAVSGSFATGTGIALLQTGQLFGIAPLILGMTTIIVTCYNSERSKSNNGN